MADEWDGLRAVFGELSDNAAAEPVAITAADVCERAVELAKHAADELVKLSQGDAELLADALARAGASRAAAALLLALAIEAADAADDVADQ